MTERPINFSNEAIHFLDLVKNYLDFPQGTEAAMTTEAKRLSLPMMADEMLETAYVLYEAAALLDKKNPEIAKEFLTNMEIQIQRLSNYQARDVLILRRYIFDHGTEHHFVQPREDAMLHILVCAQKVAEKYPLMALENIMHVAMLSRRTAPHISARAFGYTLPLVDAVIAAGDYASGAASLTKLLTYGSSEIQPAALVKYGEIIRLRKLSSSNEGPKSYYL